jgi:hypothetical protein
MNCLRPADVKQLAEYLTALRDEQMEAFEGAQTEAELWRLQGAVRVLSTAISAITKEIV